MFPVMTCKNTSILLKVDISPKPFFSEKGE